MSYIESLLEDKANCDRRISLYYANIEGLQIKKKEIDKKLHIALEEINLKSDNIKKEIEK